MKFKTLLLSICGFFLTVSLYSQTYAIYVSDATNFTTGPWKIIKYDANGNNPQTFIDTNLGWPQDILFLEDQNVVLISNLTTGRITRHHAQTGAYISNFATGIGGPTRMKIGADDMIYVLQWNGNGKVLRYLQDGTFVDEFTATGVDQSIGLDWDSSGNLYVSSYTADLVQKFSSTGADMGTFISSNLVGPTNIYFGAGGNLFVVDYDGGAVKQFSSTGSYLGVYISGLLQPEGVAFNPVTGDMLLGNGGTSAVKRFSSSGGFIEDIVTSGSGGLVTPNAVVLRDNTLSIADFRAGQQLVTITTGQHFELHQDALFNFNNIAVFNLSGQQLFSFNTSNTSWNASDQPPGVYFIVASKNGAKIAQKIIVK